MRAPSLLAAVALLSCALCSPVAATNLRVLVASGSAVSVRVPIVASVPQNADPNTAAPVGGTYDWSVGTTGANLALNGQDAHSDTLYLPPVPGSVVDIAGHRYRGGVLLRAVSGTVAAVNVVDLEDYLRGVVPAEMPSGWPLEALKAQAVVARTYAAARINPASYYDLCATDACQVYGGLEREAVGSDAAVAATRAQVVSYGGAAAKTYFSSDSGGYTASSAETWGEALPYLTARPDPASQGPNSRWTLMVPLAKVTEIAARYRVNVGPVRAVNLAAVSTSGRATAVVVQGQNGSRTLQGAEAGGFVRSLGAKSSRVSFSGTDPLIVQGAGAGHGVGLSQWGAAGLARQGWNYLQIMGFYYGGASISSILGAQLPGGELSAGLTFGEAERAWAAQQGADEPLAARPARLQAPSPLAALPPLTGW